MTETKTTGVPGAAKYLADHGVKPTTEKGVARAADVGAIQHTRDHANRRVFAYADLDLYVALQKARGTCESCDD